MDSSLADYLSACSYWRRSMRLSIETDEVLRKGSGRHQRRRQAKLLAEAQRQVQKQLRDAKRRQFRGEVSVELHIFAASDRELPSAPWSVKRYLDALKGLAYRDDAQVAHLYVTSRRTGMRLGGEGSSGAKAYLTLTPLRLYIDDYERAFAMREDEDDRHLWPRTSFGDPQSFWEDGWTDHDQERFEDLLEESADDDRRRGVYSDPDSELAQIMRQVRTRQIDELRGKLLLDQKPDRYHRPGPPEPDWDEDWLKQIGLPNPGNTDLWEFPGKFWLPLHPGTSGGVPWQTTVREAMQEHRKRWNALPAAFDRPLALDIGVQGSRTNSGDLDNVAHVVLAAFEDLYCGERRGTVVSYRAYRCAGEHAGIRVQVMADDRLNQLDRTIEAARDRVIERGGEEDWI